MTEAPNQPGNASAPNSSTDELGASDLGGYRVTLPDFEGPLDLLLHLIQEHQLNILDIPIGFVTQKYVEYITLMQELNIDMASEYLVMAATLAHIKSKMLLPTPPQDEEEENEIELDPRAELVRRLLEYQKYKDAAEQLGGRAVLGRDVFVRGMPAPDVDGPAPLAPLGVFKLLDAFQSVLSRAKTTVEHQINFERFSISDRITQLAEILRTKRKVRFEELFEGQEYRSELIVTFLAILEMTRLRMTLLTQEAPLEPIFIELAVTDDEVEGLTAEAIHALNKAEETDYAAKLEAAAGEAAESPPAPLDDSEDDADLADFDAESFDASAFDDPELDDPVTFDSAGFEDREEPSQPEPFDPLVFQEPEEEPAPVEAPAVDEAEPEPEPVPDSVQVDEDDEIESTERH